MVVDLFEVVVAVNVENFGDVADVVEVAVAAVHELNIDVDVVNMEGDDVHCFQ